MQGRAIRTTAPKGCTATRYTAPSKANRLFYDVWVTNNVRTISGFFFSPEQLVLNKRYQLE